MNILQCSSDRIGGAARAALRLHRAFSEVNFLESRMLVKDKLVDDWRIEEAKVKYLNGLFRATNSIIDQIPLKIFRANGNIPRSSGFASMLTAKAIDRKKFDIVHLHWICSGFLSIEEIGRIKSPLVWTLHDMWGFAGAEHLSEYGGSAGWRNAYADQKKSFLDFDRFTWLRKKKSWKEPIQIIAPSKWLANCVKESSLMGGWDVTVIPNVLNTNIFRPIPKLIARQILGLPAEGKLVLYGAIGGTSLPYKGWDLLVPALSGLHSSIKDIQAVVIGQSQPRELHNVNMPLHWMGHIYDDVTLALIYSAVDVTVIPSRQESFGQVGSEAQACGCPVVAFNTTGLKDVVEHQATGYLAEPFSVDDLRRGILWVLENSENSAGLSQSARKRALKNWSPEIVVPQHLNLYKKIACMDK